MNWYHWHKELSKEADGVSDRMRELDSESKLPGAQLPPPSQSANQQNHQCLLAF
jgi:hypothetical protein